MFSCVIACLLSFYLFRLAARNGSSHCVKPKKKQATLRSRGTYLGSAGLDPSFFLLSSSTMIFSSPLPPPLSKTYELNTHGKLWYTQPLPEISIRNEKPQLIFIVLLSQLWFFVFFWHALFKPCRIIIFCSSLQSQIWIRFLTNSVGGNCEHAFSYWKYTFFIKSPKHPKRYTGHPKENRLFLKFAFRSVLVPEC